MCKNLNVKERNPYKKKVKWFTGFLISVFLIAFLFAISIDAEENNTSIATEQMGTEKMRQSSGIDVNTLFDWNPERWQERPEIERRPYPGEILTTLTRFRPIPTELRHHATSKYRYTVKKLGATRPVILFVHGGNDIQNILKNVENYSNIEFQKKPPIKFEYFHGDGNNAGNRGFKGTIANQGNESPITMNTIHQLTPVGLSDGRFMHLARPEEEVYYHPEKDGDYMEITMNYIYRQAEQWPYFGIVANIHDIRTYEPKVVKAVHVVSEDGGQFKAFGGIQEQGEGGTFGTSVQFEKKQDIENQGYEYQGYDVYQLKNWPESNDSPSFMYSGTNSEWNGELGTEYIGIVFKYKKNKKKRIYNVKFKDSESDEEISDPQNVEDGELVSKPKEPQKTGYNFLGWYKSDGSHYRFDTPVTGDLTLYAKWEEQNFTVRFDSKGGETTPTTVNVKYGEKVPKPETPKRTGYKFLGWYKSDGSQYVFDTPVTGDLTLYAKWKEQNFTVRFDSKGGETTPTTVEVKYGEKVEEPESPRRDGYEFLGWYKSDGSQYIFDTPVTGDLTLYAKWKEQKFTVTFDSKGGETKPISVEVKYGEKVEEPESPRRDGYEFLGWYPKGEEKVYDFNTPVETDLILEAKWEIPVVNPLDGKTPINKEYVSINSSNEDKDLRIGYVTPFEFEEMNNYVYKSTSNNALADRVLLKNDKRDIIPVPTFVSVIDGRGSYTDPKSWSLTVKASDFYDLEEFLKVFKEGMSFEEIEEITKKQGIKPITRLSINLSELNYAETLDQELKPDVTDGNVQITKEPKVISESRQKKGNSWSLAFGKVIEDEKGKNISSGVELQVPAGTVKKSVEHISILNWELAPAISPFSGGEEYE